MTAAKVFFGSVLSASVLVIIIILSKPGW